MPERLRTRPRGVAILLLCVFASAAPLVAQPPGDSTENRIFRELTGEGVALGSDSKAPLPAPTLPDGLDAGGQQQALAALQDDTHPVSALLRQSVVAPLKLKISDIGAGKSGRRVDLWFVVYADLDRIADADVLRRGFEAESKSEGAGALPALTEISEADLQKRGISLSKQQRWFAGSANLFDRVQLQATLAGEQTRTPESVLVAMRVDPRFDEDGQFPNRWLPLVRDEAGKQKPGQPHPYHAAGGYVKATRLQNPTGAVLIEYHLAFDEPADWFGGANLLRSKLPIVCQDGVRKFRRRLATP